MTTKEVRFEELESKFGECPMLRVQPFGYAVPEPYKQDINTFLTLEVRPDDIWLVGLPKTGTWWATEMIWGVYHEGDLTEANKKYPTERWMAADWNAGMAVADVGLDEKALAEKRAKTKHLQRDGFLDLKNAKSPRFIRCHNPFSLLPSNLLDTCKVVYITRNFKDQWVSFHKMTEGGHLQHASKIDDTANQYLKDEGWFSPVTEHVKEAWKKRDHKNLHFLLYEDMKKDLPGEIRKMAKFLGKTITEDKIAALVDHLSVDSMRKNKYTNMEEFKELGWVPEGHQFIRKGVSGDWKNHFSPELLEKYEAWWNKHMSDCDFKFPE